MSQPVNAHDNAVHVEPDVSPKVSILIWVYLFIFAALLFLAMGALTIYFRYELEKERLVKVGEVESSEKVLLRNFEQGVFVGNQKIVDGKRQISIDEAMDKVVSAYSRKN